MIIAMLFFFFIASMAIAGYYSKSLSRSGTVAAIIVGCAVYSGFEMKGLLLLGIFFASSSYWSKYKSALKMKMEEKLAKGATRDWRQVLANGGAAALYSVLYFYQPSPLFIVGFTAALASANSDTWASEIGSLSKQNPLYIRTWKRVEKGTSGAVSGLGTVAAILGSLLIALMSILVFNLPLLLGWVIFLSGYLGNVIDTLIGAYYQQLYVCQNCGIKTEKTVHCGLPAVRIKGISCVDNDMVNFLSGAFASLLAIFFYFQIQ
ncbi:DUF92 domain-containing protein [Neobacillus sp. YIM B02564]|uniref:DUF92 domain-containing protein n=1 Tax=Neobacillus paridis TaxID=2803862 RepID=A0ABS1TLG5_9BACI|nr:DUF92 domain-containing protein [Neobacillus paridis]MBL4951403.1 DUF92 domain-containing protein [Neobacillus paridis]